MIVRGPRPSDNFAQIHNDALADGRLSFKARGILAFLLSRPPGWKTSAERLAKSGIDGERAVKSGLKELEATGYLKRTRTHADGSDPNHPAGTWIHNQVITDQPATIAVPEVDTTGAKRTDGEVSGQPIDTTGTFRTGAEQPGINNTEPNNTYLGAGDVDTPTLVGGAPAPTSRTTYGDDRDSAGGVGSPIPSRPRGWMPSDAALKTAHDSIELMDIALSITHYRIRAKELGREPSSGEWLRWLIEDEKKARIEERKQAQANGQKKPWFAVAGD